MDNSISQIKINSTIYDIDAKLFQNQNINYFATASDYETLSEKVNTNATDIKTNSNNISSVNEIAQKTKDDLDAFLADADLSTNAIDTLKEIQKGLDAGEASAASLLDSINDIQTGDIVVGAAAKATTDSNGNNIATQFEEITVNLSNHQDTVASANALGHIKIGFAQSGRDYPLKLDNSKAYVSIPWTDTMVNNKARGTTQSYLLGTSSTPTANNVAVTALSETGVYVKTENSQSVIVAPVFEGTLKGNANTATQAYSTITNPSSGTRYQIPFIATTSSDGNISLLKNDGIGYWTKEGTTSAVGVGELKLGNSIASGTAGNKNGMIYMYGNSSGYTEIIPTNNTTSNTQVYLPSSSGSLALTSDNVASATKLSKVVNLSSSGSSNAGKCIKFGSIDISSGTWNSCAGTFIFNTMESGSGCRGVLSFFLRTSSTNDTQSGSLYWISLADSAHANSVIVVKTDAGKFDLYFKPKYTYETAEITGIFYGDVNDISLANSGTYVDESTLTALYVSSLKTVSSSCTGNAATATTASKLGSSTVGGLTKPIYLNSGAATECSSYAGGTAVTLNGSSKAASTASFYAPTSVGTSGYILKSAGSGAPTWIQSVPVANGGTGATTAAGAITNLGAMDLTSAQTASGVKTFSNGIKIGSATLTYDSTNEQLVLSFT